MKNVTNIMNSKLLLFAFSSLIFIFNSSNDVFAESSSNVYQIPNIDFDKDSYTWGEQGSLLMVSPLDNKDPQRIEVITSNNSTFESRIHGYSDSSNPQENFVLTETGPDTGVFEWVFVITEHGTKQAYDVNSNYIIVSNSTEFVGFQFDVEPNSGYGTSARITHPDDDLFPGYGERPRTSMYPNIQFRMIEQTSPYDGHGTITVRYPSHNMSPVTTEQLTIGFSAQGANSIFEILNETGPDTGVFDGPLSISTHPSFSKLQITNDDGFPSRTDIRYLDSDTLFSSISHALVLHHEFEFPDNKPGRIHSDSDLSVHSDKKAYLAGQPIRISGFSEPDEIIHVTLLAHKGPEVMFEKIQSGGNGEFKTEFILPDGASSGMYSLAVTSIKNDKQEKRSMIIASIEDLQSHSIRIPPRQQSEMGLSADQIVCKRVWKSLLKPSGNIPVCVELPTYHKLLERGWEPVLKN